MNDIIIFGILLVLALSFDFLNGFHDSANVVATIIASRALSPRLALTMAASADFLGPLLFGTAVAKTVGDGLVAQDVVTITMVTAALLAASLWNIVTWWFGIPSSSSHALVGGLVGGAIALGGWNAVILSGLYKVLLALFVSPLLGFAVGWIVLRLTLLFTRRATPKINRTFNRLQLLTGGTLALSHGANDAQKTMGIITMGLLALGFQDSFHVPLWVVLASASAIAAGTATGGWRIIHTLGGKFYRIRPIHSLTSQFASASVILGASILGGPVSTTHVVSSSIVGVGASERMSKVRWTNLTDIGIAWVVTIPVTLALSAIFYYILRIFMGV